MRKKRICSRCGCALSKTTASPSVIQNGSWCRNCHNVLAQKWYRTHRKESLAANRLWRLSHLSEKRALNRRWKRNNIGKVLFMSARNRARKSGWAFNLKMSDIVVPERCPILGIKLVAHCGTRNKKYPNSPSLDRIDSSKGYVRGNIAVVSWRANEVKKNGTAAEHRKIATWMQRAFRVACE